MQIGQLRRLIEALSDFGSVVCGTGEGSDLRSFAAVFPSNSKQTTTQFIANLKKSLSKGGRFDCPAALRSQLEAIETALSLAGGTSSNDIKGLLAVLESSRSANLSEFIQRIVAAREFVPPVKTPKPKTEPKTDAVVAGYVDRLKRSAAKSREFEVVFSSLKSDSKLSDARVKKISKALWGKPASSRAEAFNHILAYQNREVLAASSARALDLSPV